MVLAVLSLVMILMNLAISIYLHVWDAPYDTVTPSDLYERDIHDVSYNLNGSNTDHDVFVVPRRAYYYKKKPLYLKNTVLIVAEVHDDASDSIVACQLNGLFSDSVHVVKDHYLANWVKHHAPKSYTHRVLLVHCLGFPENIITRGSFTKLVYRKEGEEFYSQVRTERSLVFVDGGADDPAPSRGRGSIVVCTTLYDHPSMFNDWLIYQKTLGVDLVHINTDVSFQKHATKSYPFLKESLENGFAQMDVWNHITGERLFYQGQIMKYQDCLYRYKGVYEYGIFYDVDDFFNPIHSDHKDMHYYFEMFFSSASIACTCFSWRLMHCKPRDDLRKTLTDGNLTKILGGLRSNWIYELKCAYRLNLVEIVSIHKPDRILDGYRHIAERTQAYVAHNRQAAEYPC